MKSLIRIFLLFVLLSGIFIAAIRAQEIKTIDSLTQVLETDITDRARVDTWNLLAGEYNTSDALKTADYTSKAIALSKKINYLEGISDAYYRIGVSTAINGDHNKATELYTQALISAREASYKKGEGNAYNGLGAIHTNQGNYPKALEYHLKSLEIQEDLGNKGGMANSYINIGNIQYYQGNYSKALEYYFKSLKTNEEIDNKSRMASNYNNIGFIYSSQGNYPKALEYYLKSLKIKEKIGNKLGVASTYNNIGIIHADQDNYPKALEYYLKSLKIREEISDKSGMAHSYNNIGTIHSYQGNYPKALEYHLKALKTREELGDKNGMAYSYTNIGLVYKEQGNYPKALEYCLKALKIKEKIGEKGGQTYDLIALGDAYREMKQYAKAIQYLTEGLALAQEVGVAESVREGAEALAKTYEATGDYEAAYQNHVLFKQMTDSLKNEENTKKLTQQSMQYEFNKQKAAAKAEQEKKDLLQRQELQKRNYIIYGAGLGLGGLLVFAVFLFRNYQQKQKANKLLAAQKEEIQRTNEELNAKNKQLNELYEEQNGIMRVVAHDLKSPLNSIYSILQLIEREKNGASNSEHQYYNMIYKVIAGGQNLIQDLTDIHEAEDLQTKMCYEKTAVEEFISEIIEIQRKKAESKAIAIHYESTLSYTERELEQDYIRRIIENILSNAIKFSPQERNIYVNLSDTSNYLKISIKDEGPGFSEKDKENAFKKFQRLSARPTKGEHSSGLGLSIVKALTERLNGTIRLISEKGKGAEFIIEIPAEIVVVA